MFGRSILTYFLMDEYLRLGCCDWTHHQEDDNCQEEVKYESMDDVGFLSASQRLHSFTFDVHKKSEAIMRATTWNCYKDDLRTQNPSLFT